MRALVVFVGLAIAAGCSGGPVATPVGTPAATVQLTAVNIAWTQRQLSVPAAVTFAIELDNRDSAPHNVVISGAPPTANDDPFTGPATRTIVFSGLTPGTYTYVCAVHPDMKGTLTVGS